MMNITEILENLTQLNSPSGNETEVRECIISMVKPYCDELYTDAMGNLIVHKKGKGTKIMLAAHMDEIGVIATDVDDKGFIRFASVGGLNTRCLVNMRVQFGNGTVGVIGAQEEEFKDNPETDKLYIDIGAGNKDEALKYIKIGDSAAFLGDMISRGDTIVSKALDNRAGCAVLIDVLHNIESSGNDLYFVFTVQEEVGLRGAKTAAFSIEPDIAIAVDVTDTGDTPAAPNMAVSLGKGTAVKVMDRSVICDADVRIKMIETAKKNNIPYQLEIMTDGGTDAGAIHLSRAGVKTGGVSIPLRYVHSPSEMANLNDIKASLKLLQKLVTETWEVK